MGKRTKSPSIRTTRDDDDAVSILVAEDDKSESGSEEEDATMPSQDTGMDPSTQVEGTEGMSQSGGASPPMPPVTTNRAIRRESLRSHDSMVNNDTSSPLPSTKEDTGSMAVDLGGEKEGTAGSSGRTGNKAKGKAKVPSVPSSIVDTNAPPTARQLPPPSSPSVSVVGNPADAPVPTGVVAGTPTKEKKARAPPRAALAADTQLQATSQVQKSIDLVRTELSSGSADWKACRKAMSDIGNLLHALRNVPTSLGEVRATADSTHEEVMRSVRRLTSLLENVGSMRSDYEKELNERSDYFAQRLDDLLAISESIADRLNALEKASLHPAAPPQKQGQKRKQNDRPLADRVSPNDSRQAKHARGGSNTDSVDRGGQQRSPAKAHTGSSHNANRLHVTIYGYRGGWGLSEAAALANLRVLVNGLPSSSATQAPRMPRSVRLLPQESDSIVLTFSSGDDANLFVQVWNQHNPAGSVAFPTPPVSNFILEPSVASSPSSRAIPSDAADVAPDRSTIDTVSHVSSSTRLNDTPYQLPAVQMDIDSSELSIFSWNVHGHLMVNLLQPDFVDLWKDCDIVLFQETHLFPGQEASLSIPEGFDVFVNSRPFTEITMDSWGGVLALVRSDLHASEISHLRCPDVLILEVAGHVVFNCYIVPENSELGWDYFSETHPFDRLWGAVSATCESGKSVLLFGDLNGRIGNKIPVATHPNRASVDNTSNTRGNQLLQACRLYDLVVVNGSEGIPGRHNTWTSFNSCTRRSVIDYALCSTIYLPFVKSFDILEHDEELSDHSALKMVLLSPNLTRHKSVPQADGVPRMARRRRNPLSVESDLDRLLADLVEADVSDEQQLLLTYGAVSQDATRAARKVYLGAYSIRSENEWVSGSSAYFGSGSIFNAHARVPGRATNNRAVLYSLLLAVAYTPLNMPLEVHTASPYLIDSLIAYGPNHARCGWACEHGDLLSLIQKWLQHRTAQILFTLDDGKQNAHSASALFWASVGAGNDLPSEEDIEPFLPPDWLPGESMPVTGTPKICDVSPSRLCSVNRDVSNQKQSHNGVFTHRGRTRRRQLQQEILDNLVEASSNSASFWSLYKGLTRSKAKESPVTLEDLTDSIRGRMNPVPIERTNFDSASMVVDEALAEAIPDASQPSIQFPILNTLFTEKDIEAAKLHLRDKSGSGKATGWDDISYQMIMEMDNKSLLHLINECVRKRDVPSAWLKTVVAGILKKNGHLHDASSYRAIALESCVLRFATLMIHMRFAVVLEENHILPDSQNGFRAEFRTNNNAFILRSLIERARASNETLHVAFVDISNAFPSTSHAVLWLKLEKYGLTGIYFDWLRMLYQRMEYVVSLGGKLSVQFKSLCGVLAGDPASPTLWNIFLADFSLWPDCDDASLLTRAVSHLEHADDMVIVSKSARGLQRHLDTVANWCRTNYLQVNASKSAVMLFGPLPTQAPVYSLNDSRIPIQSRWKYVGILFDSTTPNIFRAFYREKAHTARGVAAAGIFGTERLIGRNCLPPNIARTLYTALVDCHLTAGCDVVIDTDVTGMHVLEQVQHDVLRRVLGFSSRSPLAPLFSELGLIPLRFRRLLLALRYLQYLVTRPKNQLAYEALLSSADLRSKGIPSWLGDLDWVLQTLSPRNIRLPMSLDSLTPDLFATLTKGVLNAASETIELDIRSRSSLYLLDDRREPLKDGKYMRRVITYRRYLSAVTVPKYRRLLTRVLCGSVSVNGFASDRGSCPWCDHATDTLEHAFLYCLGNPNIVSLRAQLRDKVISSNWEIAWPALTLSERASTALLKDLIYHWHAVIPVASFLYQLCMARGMNVF